MLLSQPEKRWLPSPIAWRQYKVTLASGFTATLGFSLGDPADADTARVMRAYDASHMGLFVVLDDPQSAGSGRALVPAGDVPHLACAGHDQYR